MARRNLSFPPLEIEILVSDVREQEDKANAAIDEGHYAKVHKKGNWPIRSGWRCITDMFDDRLRICQRDGVGIDTGLAYFLTCEVVKAKSTPKKDGEGQQEYCLGAAVHILHYPGCRAYITQDKFAEKYGYSRQHVNRQWGRLKKWGFIINYGQGWIEFDCNLLWRGKLDILSAYQPVQQIHDDLVEQSAQANGFFSALEPTEMRELEQPEERKASMSRTNQPHHVFEKIDMKNGDDSQCWPWKGGCTGEGRPAFALHGRKVVPYRLVYELTRGVTLFKSDNIRHTCGNKQCCNPTHLEQPAPRRKEDKTPEHRRLGLTFYTLRAIKTLLKTGEAHESIAAKFGVDSSIVERIARGEA